MDVDIWSDIACPWCYLGARRLELAIEQFAGGDDVRIVHRAFELDPDAPADSGYVGTDKLLAAKYGMSEEQARAANDRLAGLGTEVGLEYRLDRARPGNTFDAHRLVKLAAAHGKADAANARLFRAYFTDGKLMSDPETLVEVGEAIGLDPVEIRAMLESNRFADAVRADEAAARQLNINGVPFFAIDGRIGVSGAQPIAVLVEALDEAVSAPTS